MDPDPDSGAHDPDPDLDDSDPDPDPDLGDSDPVLGYEPPHSWPMCSLGESLL